MELSNPLAIEHGIERGYFVYIHFVDFSDFGYFAHCGEGEEVLVLFLGESQQRYNGWPFPVGRVFIEYFVNFFVIIGSEVEGRWVVIGLGFPVGEVASWKLKDVAFY